MALTHWKKLENPDYIGAYAFQPGETKAVTIRQVKREMVNGADGKREECTVVHFVENEKPLILNTTNAKMITKHAGTPYIEQWPGVRITLAAGLALLWMPCRRGCARLCAALVRRGSAGGDQDR